MQIRVLRAYVVLIVLFGLINSELSGQQASKEQKNATVKLEKWVNPVNDWYYPSEISPDSVRISEGKRVEVYFPADFSYNSFREDNIAMFKNSLADALGKKFRNYTIEIYAGGTNIEHFVPNIYRNSFDKDSTRIINISGNRPVLIEKPDYYKPVSGLNGYNIALWHSHGYYFDMTLDRWEFQRAKLFGTVEDLSVMAYVLPYLTPMLERSGATVFLPRERDTQVNEVIVDNDKSSGNSEFVIHVNNILPVTHDGFMMADTVFPGDNPFRMGTSVQISGTAEYLADFPGPGMYAVYVSYPLRNDNSDKVKYEVHHTGGTTSFIINQTIGGGTWIYLGTFRFNSGKSAEHGSVIVSAPEGGRIALDAVRFGGGMGNVARRPSVLKSPNQKSVNAAAGSESQTLPSDTVKHSWKLSGKPRYIEGARYYLQYAGMPDTLVYNLNRNRNDYNDDYQSRSEWVNYLIKPPSQEPGTDNETGCGLPVDLAFAFHTDAGVTPDDSIIGTLGIYSTATGNGFFPDGKNRLASRDLADIIQTQIVEDVRSLFNPEWTRRGLWDKLYYEARKPDVPTMLLELLSHQNLGDQQYGLDPRFRFHVSRAVYKGMLRYLSYANSRDYVVQPLPVDHFAVTPVEGRIVRLSWEPVADALEPSALPTGYRVYGRKGSDGFGNGLEVKNNYLDVIIDQPDVVYSFKVTAVNDGGESFDSEILSVGLADNAAGMVLVVNAFDRISGPAWFDKEGMAGVEWWNDRGVADKYDIVPTGDQYDFARSSPWIDDDAPGWGASYSDMEGKMLPGNSFDFPFIHGESVMNTGYSFVSVSDEVFNSPAFSISQYAAVDVILGEEKTTPSAFDASKTDFTIYTKEFVDKLGELNDKGIPLFMSGSYVGTDMLILGDKKTAERIALYAGFVPRTGHAVRRGRAYSTDAAAHYFTGEINFNTGNSFDIYAAEAPDAIEAAHENAVTAFRYSDNNTSSCVLSESGNRTVIMGFPFETITDRNERDRLMSQVLHYLIRNK